MGSVNKAVKMLIPGFTFTLFLTILQLSQVCAECPNENFLEKHVCDQCRHWRQVVDHQMGVGAKGITAVMGPPVHTYPPLFRKNGPYVNDLCLNRQARPAYRCNMAAKKPYCFKVANRCYTGHYPGTGDLDKAWDRMALIHCVDDPTWEGQHTYDDYSDTNRRDDT